MKIKNMEEFATLSGISRPTVSKYFHDPSSVRETTRVKIEAAIKLYNYRPNVYAINQNRKNTKNIGIVVPFLSDPFFAELARNLEQRCIEVGYSPNLFSSHGNQAQENEIFDTLRAIKPAGVLFAPLGRTSDLKAVRAFCQEVPTVLFDSYLPDIGLAFVGSDNEHFAGLMVEYLCRTGSPPSFLEMENPPNPNANRRRQGYLNAMERLGHTPCIVKVPGDGWDFEEIGKRGGEVALSEGLFATDTVLCSNDRLAIGFLSACCARGMRVGCVSEGEIRVAGQDDHPFSRFTCPSLTTISQDYDAISRQAASTLFNFIDGVEIKHESKFHFGRLVLRNSA